MSLSEAQPQILSTSVTTLPVAASGTGCSSTTQSKEAIKDVVFGSLAGVAGKFIEYPFDTVKVRLQSQPGTVANGASNGLYYSGPIDCFRKSWTAGGARNLYRGVSAPLVGAAVETSSLFFSYRLAQEAVCALFYPEIAQSPPSAKKELPFGVLLACGAASGAFTSLLLTPIELVKCQMQAEPAAGQATSSIQKSPGSVMKDVWRNHGFRGFWRGQMGTLIRETGGSSAWFGSYEGVGSLLKMYMPPRTSSGNVSDTPVWHKLVAGASAGMSYNFLFYPADTIKSRMQTEQISEGLVSAHKIRPTFWSVGRDLWQQQGIRGMYRGCGITVARSAPSSAIIFAMFEWLRTTFG